MADQADSADSAADAIADSEGDPRVLFVLNLVFSGLFAYTVVWGLSFIDVLAFSWPTVGLLTAIVMSLTYLVVY